MEKRTEQTLFSKDRSMVLLTIVVSVLASINTLVVFVRLRSHDFKVPVQYVVNDGSVLQVANWYTLYSLAFVSAASSAMVIFLAHRLYKANRTFAQGLMVTYVAMLVVSFLVINALLGLVARV